MAGEAGRRGVGGAGEGAAWLEQEEREGGERERRGGVREKEEDGRGGESEEEGN